MVNCEAIKNPISERVVSSVSPEIQISHFFTTLRDFYGIGNIYYPGCDVDRVLEMGFSEDEIIYLDEYMDKKDGPKNLIVGDFNKPPLRFNSVDSVFIQDLHLEKHDLDNILKVVKDGGILVYSTDDCGLPLGDDRTFILEHPLLVQVDFPSDYEHYWVFQKINPKI